MPSISKIRFECKKVYFYFILFYHFCFSDFWPLGWQSIWPPVSSGILIFSRYCFCIFCSRLKSYCPVYLLFEFDNLQFLVLGYSIMSFERPKKVVCPWMGLVYPTFTKSTFKNWPKIISLLYSKRYIFSPSPPGLHSSPLFQDFKRKFKME